MMRSLIVLTLVSVCLSADLPPQEVKAENRDGSAHGPAAGHEHGGHSGGHGGAHGGGHAPAHAPSNHIVHDSAGGYANPAVSYDAPVSGGYGSGGAAPPQSYAPPVASQGGYGGPQHDYGHAAPQHGHHGGGGYGGQQAGNQGYYYYYYPVSSEKQKGGKRHGYREKGGKNGNKSGGFMSGLGKGMKKAFAEMRQFFTGGYDEDYGHSGGSAYGSSGFGGGDAYDRDSRSGMMDRVMDVGMGVLFVGALAAAAPAVMSMVQALGLPVGITGRSLRNARDMSYQIYETAKVKVYENGPSSNDLARLTETVTAAIENEECLQRFWCQFGRILKKYKYSQKAVSVAEQMVSKYGPSMAHTPLKAVKRSMELGVCEKFKCGTLIRN